MPITMQILKAARRVSFPNNHLSALCTTYAFIEISGADFFPLYMQLLYSFMWLYSIHVCALHSVSALCVFVCQICHRGLLPLGCVYPSCAGGSEQHLFRGCCSSWLLFNWISSSRAKSCHLCQALLAITAGPYIK